MLKEGLYVRWISLLVFLGCIPFAYAERPLMTDEKALYDAIDANRQQYIVFLRELIQASENGEAAVQAVVAKRFEDLDCDVETLELLPTRLSLEKEFAAEEAIDMTERITVVGKLTGTGGGKSLLFFGHPDPEPFTDESKEGWTRNPFGGVVPTGGTTADVAIFGTVGFLTVPIRLEPNSVRSRYCRQASHPWPAGCQSRAEKLAPPAA